MGELGKEGGRGYLVIVDRRDREEGFRLAVVVEASTPKDEERDPS